jgi:hypothetical protein
VSDQYRQGPIYTLLNPNTCHPTGSEKYTHEKEINAQKVNAGFAKRTIYFHPMPLNTITPDHDVEKKNQKTQQAEGVFRKPDL